MPRRCSWRRLDRLAPHFRSFPGMGDFATGWARRQFPHRADAGERRPAASRAVSHRAAAASRLRPDQGRRREVRGLLFAVARHRLPGADLPRGGGLRDLQRRGQQEALRHHRRRPRAPRRQPRASNRRSITSARSTPLGRDARQVRRNRRARWAPAARSAAVRPRPRHPQCRSRGQRRAARLKDAITEALGGRRRPAPVRGILRRAAEEIRGLRRRSEDDEGVDL